MIKNNFQLKEYNTFGLEAKATTFINLDSEKEAVELLSKREIDLNNSIILGGGSNILFTKDFNGTVLHPRFNTIEVVARGEKSVFVAAEAGVIWDDLVAWSVERELGGIENLSYIPGRVGAAPIQNIGAYGAEVSDVITTVRAINLEDGTSKEFQRDECNFGYRNSIFNNEMKGKFLISSIIIELQRYPAEFDLSYGDLKRRVADLGIVNLHNIRDAVIAVRKEKLPEPSELGNAGSFFKNPVVDDDLLNALLVQFPDIPNWPAQKNNFRIPAAWLIEKAGWKGYRSGEAGVHHLQPLVLVNLGNATGYEIFELGRRIIESVSEKFGITLEYEVNII